MYIYIYIYRVRHTRTQRKKERRHKYTYKLVCLNAFLPVSGVASSTNAPPQQDETNFKILNAILRAMVGGPFTVVYVYAGELLPSTLRSSTISFCNSFGRLAAMLAPVVETAAVHVDVNLIYYSFSLVALAATVASILHFRETLGRPLLLYTSQLKEQREEDEKQPLMTRYAPFMAKWRTE